MDKYSGVLYNAKQGLLTNLEAGLQSNNEEKKIKLLKQFFGRSYFSEENYERVLELLYKNDHELYSVLVSPSRNPYEQYIDFDEVNRENVNYFLGFLDERLNSISQKNQQILETKKAIEKSISIKIEPLKNIADRYNNLLFQMDLKNDIDKQKNSDIYTLSILKTKIIFLNKLSYFVKNVLDDENHKTLISLLLMSDSPVIHNATISYLSSSFRGDQDKTGARDNFLQAISRETDSSRQKLSIHMQKIEERDALAQQTEFDKELIKISDMFETQAHWGQKCLALKRFLTDYYDEDTYLEILDFIFAYRDLYNEFFLQKSQRDIGSSDHELPNEKIEDIKSREYDFDTLSGEIFHNFIAYLNQQFQIYTEEIIKKQKEQQEEQKKEALKQQEKDGIVLEDDTILSVEFNENTNLDSIIAYLKQYESDKQMINSLIVVIFGDYYHNAENHDQTMSIVRQYTDISFIYEGDTWEPTYEEFQRFFMREKVIEILLSSNPEVQNVIDMKTLSYKNSFEKSLNTETGKKWAEEMLALRIDNQEQFSEADLDDYLGQIGEKHPECDDLNYIIAIKQKAIIYMMEHLYSNKTHEYCMQTLYDKTGYVFQGGQFIQNKEATQQQIIGTATLSDEQIGEFIEMLQMEYIDYKESWLEDISMYVNAEIAH